MADGDVLTAKLLDLSHYDLATFNAPCFKQQGVTRVILGTTVLPTTRGMTQALLAQGIEVELYGIPYFGHPFYEWRDANNALQVIAEFRNHPLFHCRYWIDCEIDSSRVSGMGQTYVPTASSRVNVIRQVRDRMLAEDQRVGIYTGRPWWIGATANSSAFRDLPLWIAWYGVNSGPRPPIYDLGASTFGGWSHVAIHQYTSTLEICGRRRDHNYLFQTEFEMCATCQKLIEVIGGSEGWVDARLQQIRDNPGTIKPLIQSLDDSIIGSHGPQSGDPPFQLRQAYQRLVGRIAGMRSPAKERFCVSDELQNHEVQHPVGGKLAPFDATITPHED